MTFNVQQIIKLVQRGQSLYNIKYVSNYLFVAYFEFALEKQDDPNTHNLRKWTNIWRKSYCIDKRRNRFFQESIWFFFYLTFNGVDAASGYWCFKLHYSAPAEWQKDKGQVTKMPNGINENNINVRWEAAMKCHNYWDDIAVVRLRGHK